MNKFTIKTEEEIKSLRDFIDRITEDEQTVLEVSPFEASYVLQPMPMASLVELITSQRYFTAPKEYSRTIMFCNHSVAVSVFAMLDRGETLYISARRKDDGKEFIIYREIRNYV